MRHLGGDDHRDLDKSGDPALLTPRRLVDHLSDLPLLDSVAVRSAGLEKAAYNGAGALGMVVEKIVAYDVAMSGKRLARKIIHIDYTAVGITHGDRAVEVAAPLGELLFDVIHGRFVVLVSGAGTDKRQ